MRYFLKLVRVQGPKEEETLIDMWSLGIDLIDGKVGRVNRIPSEDDIKKSVKDDFK